jgi:hypothetical protein
MQRSANACQRAESELRLSIKTRFSGAGGPQDMG